LSVRLLELACADGTVLATPSINKPWPAPAPPWFPWFTDADICRINGTRDVRTLRGLLRGLPQENRWSRAHGAFGARRPQGLGLDLNRFFSETRAQSIHHEVTDPRPSLPTGHPSPLAGVDTQICCCWSLHTLCSGGVLRVEHPNTTAPNPYASRALAESRCPCRGGGWGPGWDRPHLRRPPDDGRMS